MRIKKSSKKGSWFVDNLGQLILMAIGIGIGIYFIWAYILHGGGDTLNNLQKCGSLTGNNGVCKEVCDKSTELELPNVGCKGIENKCCVPKDDNINTLHLPSGYGGNDQYNFVIDSFNIDTSSAIEGCEASVVDTSRIECHKNTEIKLPVIVKVTNSGTQAITVTTQPVIVLADNPTSIKSAIIDPKDASADIAGKSDQVVNSGLINTGVIISATDSRIEDGYLKIYPYAACTTNTCAKDGGDSQGRGVMTTDESKFILVKFI